MPPNTATLAGCELFQGLDEAATARLAALGVKVELPSGSVLFRMGSEADKLYAVLRGRVLLALPVRIKQTEQDLTVDEKVPGDLVGWSALVPPHRSTMTARTLVESELQVFPRDALLAALAQDPPTRAVVMGNLAAVMGRRFHQAQALWMRELQRGIKTLL